LELEGDDGVIGVVNGEVLALQEGREGEGGREGGREGVREGGKEETREG
jgi:hypothetical protein